mgnify:CR=1 FL=1
MPSAWLRDKMPEFIRDVFRGFCLAAECLEGQATLFDQETRVEFKVLEELLGHSTNKGLLWRLKDTAHHVFRTKPDATAVGRFLDWGMGYIFHETMKLKEDSYQLINYGPMFENLLADPLPELETQVGDELFKVLSQTKESMRREIDRIRFIMAQCRKLLPVYLSGHSYNPLVARFIFMDNELVRRVFGGEYSHLVSSIYKGRPELMYVLAAQSLRQGGWMDEAARAVDLAQEVNPKSERALQEKGVLDNWRKMLR